MTLDRPITKSICSKKSGGGYEGLPSIFDSIDKDDLIMAFFPCIRFTEIVIMKFQGVSLEMKNWSDIDKLELDLKYNNELHDLYELITKMAIIVLRKGLRMVIENPYSTMHYLTRYWSLKPKLVDTDRTRDGDYYKKPTQFWFVGCDPELNVLVDPIPNNEQYTIDHMTVRGISNKVGRSMIHPDYANRFIRQYIVDGDGCGAEEQLQIEF